MLFTKWKRNGTDSSWTEAHRKQKGVMNKLPIFCFFSNSKTLEHHFRLLDPGLTPGFTHKPFISLNQVPVVEEEKQHGLTHTVTDTQCERAQQWLPVFIAFQSQWASNQQDDWIHPYKTPLRVTRWILEKETSFVRGTFVNAEVQLRM